MVSADLDTLIEELHEEDQDVSEIMYLLLLIASAPAKPPTSQAGNTPPPRITLMKSSTLHVPTL